MSPEKTTPTNKANEPDTPSVDGKTIRQFSSFEEMEEDKLKYFASLSPEQLFKNLKQLIIHSYGIKDESYFKNLPRVINLNPRG